MSGSIITISINKHSKEVSCCSSLQSMRFQSVEVYLLGTFYNLKGEVSTPDDLFELKGFWGTGTENRESLHVNLYCLSTGFWNPSPSRRPSR